MRCDDQWRALWAKCGLAAEDVQRDSAARESIRFPLGAGGGKPREALVVLHHDGDGHTCASGPLLCPLTLQNIFM